MWWEGEVATQAERRQRLWQQQQQQQRWRRRPRRRATGERTRKRHDDGRRPNTLALALLLPPARVDSRLLERSSRQARCFQSAAAFLKSAKSPLVREQSGRRSTYFISSFIAKVDDFGSQSKNRRRLDCTRSFSTTHACFDFLCNAVHAAAKSAKTIRVDEKRDTCCAIFLASLSTLQSPCATTVCCRHRIDFGSCMSNILRSLKARWRRQNGQNVKSRLDEKKRAHFEQLTTNFGIKIGIEGKQTFTLANKGYKIASTQNLRA